MFAVFLCSGVASAAPGDPCTANDDCIDTIYCNGIESCNLEASVTVCVAGTAPCTGATPACDEGTDTCFECVFDTDCAEGEVCEDNLCVVASCPSDTPADVIAFDTNGDCLLNKEELKNYSDTLKIRQSAEKTALKTKHTLEKDQYKAIKVNYSN
jgi:hypothetical protein